MKFGYDICSRMNKPITLAMCALGAIATAGAEDGRKPVKVYILAGQSNMVGFGQVQDGGFSWRSGHFKDFKVSVYPGPYDPNADYDKIEPLKTVEIANIGGKGDAYPMAEHGQVWVARGTICSRLDGLFQVRPGYGESLKNVMKINGQVVAKMNDDGTITHTPIRFKKDEYLPFSVVYFGKSADSNGYFNFLDKPGTLRTAVEYKGLFPELVDKDGKWISRDDVWFKEVLFGNKAQDKWLSVGCGASTKHVGPELGFGVVMGYHHEEPVLLLKTAQGNRSLGWDFLPPGSERYELGDKIYGGYKDTRPSWPVGTEPEPDPKPKWYAGKQYDDSFGVVKKALANFDREFPKFAGRGYEIAGFVWFQGHKDQGVYSSRYETNLVRLIQSLRKDFDAPDAKFVIATGCGNPGTENGGLTVAEAQLAVDGDKGKYPEFKGIVKSVDVRPLWPVKEESPNGSQGFHYYHNAIAYTKIGQAMAKAMIEIQQRR